MIAHLKHIRFKLRARIKQRLLLAELHIAGKKHALPVYLKHHDKRIVVIIVRIKAYRVKHLKACSVADPQLRPGGKHALSKAALGYLFIELQYALVVLFAYVGAIGIVYLEGICYGFQAAGMILVAMRNEYALKLAH